MLKLSEIRKGYEEASGTLSEFNRQLCFAGFAIIWIFNGSVNGFKIPKELFIPGFLLCLSLILDIFQYICTTVVWYCFYLKQRKINSSKDEEEVPVEEPESYNVVSWLLFACKILAMISAYILIAIFLISKF